VARAPLSLVLVITAKMYHYQECGLKNVYLINGYQEIDTPYGKAISITDTGGLDKAIAQQLIAYKPKLTGSEFRFLRKHMGLSQARLATLLDKTEQSVAIWEKKATSPNGLATCLEN